MSLAVALDLCGLIEALPASTLFGVFAVDRLVREGFDDREHPPITQVSIVGDGQHAATGLLLIGGHPLPQVARIVAALRLHRNQRLNSAGAQAVVPKNDVAMQVVPASVRGPLVAN